MTGALHFMGVVICETIRKEQYIYLMRTSESNLMKGIMFTGTLGKGPRSLWMHISIL